MKNQAVVVDVRAVDVGYFSTKLTLSRKGQPQWGQIPAMLFPSMAPRQSTGGPHGSVHNQRDGVQIKIDESIYFVGRDALTSSSGVEPREVLANYCMTDKYLALTRGALHYIAEDVSPAGDVVIRNLVIGLPLTTYSKHAADLTAKFTGDHVLPLADGSGSRTVTVEAVNVVAQPQGAITNYGTLNKTNFRETNALVVDAGGGTLDWYVIRGGRSNWERSGAHPKSMLACAYAVADAIDPQWRTLLGIVDRIDQAIRDGAPSFKARGIDYDLSQYHSNIVAVLKESAEVMLSRVGTLEDVDLILFTGGGAKVFFDYFRNIYPEYSALMKVDNDPVFSNVRGFHLLGEVFSSKRVNG